MSDCVAIASSSRNMLRCRLIQSMPPPVRVSPLGPETTDTIPPRCVAALNERVSAPLAVTVAESTADGAVEHAEGAFVRQSCRWFC